jgi:acetyl-CoA synthetase
MTQTDIESKLIETRVFNPPEEFSKHAHVKSMAEYEALWKRSIEDPDGFWGEIAKDLVWFEPWKKVLEWNEPFAKWFVGGKTNVSYNCLDRHLTTWRLSGKGSPAIRGYSPTSSFTSRSAGSPTLSRNSG